MTFDKSGGFRDEATVENGKSSGRREPGKGRGHCKEGKKGEKHPGNKILPSHERVNRKK